MTKRPAEAISDLPVVLVVGAGFGGLSVVVHMLQQQQNLHDKRYRIVLVDQGYQFSIGGLWQFVWNHRLQSNQVVFDLKRLLFLKEIELQTNTKVLSWQPQQNTVQLNSGTTVSYDKIVLACGAVTRPERILGLSDHVNICCWDSVQRQRSELEALIDTHKDRDRVTFVMLISSIPYKCPVAPFEVACLVDEQLQPHFPDRTIILSCPVDWPMPPNSQPTFMEILNKKNIVFKANHEVERIQDNTIHYKNDKEPIVADCIWSNYPLAAPQFVRDALPKENIVNGFVNVTNISHQVSISNDSNDNTIDNIYCIGDCCQFEIGGMLIPKAGEFAWKMGASVAHHLVPTASSVCHDRTGRCIAELGGGAGVTVQNDFSKMVQGNGNHDITVTGTQTSETEKIGWVNSYLELLFGPSSTLELDDLARPTLSVNGDCKK